MISSRPSLDDAVGGAKTALKILAPLLNIVPFPGLSAAAQILGNIIECVETTNVNKKSFQGLVEEITKLVEVMISVSESVQERIFQRDPAAQLLCKDKLKASSKLIKESSKFIVALNEIMDKAETLSRRSPLRRFFQGNNDADQLKDLQKGILIIRQDFQLRFLEKMSATIDDILSDLGKAVRIVKDVDDVVRNEAQKQQDARDDSILRRIPHANAGYLAYHNEHKNKPLQVTRLDLVKQLEDWAASESSEKPLFLLIGDVGTDKSAIAWEFARRLDGCALLGASYFFVRDIEVLASLQRFFSTIAYQLAYSRRETLRPYIVSAAEEYLQRGNTQLMSRQFEYLVKAPLAKVGSAGHRTTVLVIDALDECAEQDRVPELLHHLIQCTRGNPFVKVFLTSRHDHLAKAQLPGDELQHIYAVSLDTPSLDLLKLDTNLTIAARPPHVSESPCKRRPDIAHRLEARAADHSVYADTVVDFVADSESPTILKERSSEKALSSGRHTPVSDLDGPYLTMLETVFPRKEMEQDPTFCKHAQSILGCIALLREPLSPEALAGLVAMSVEDCTSILYRLCSVVHYDFDDPSQIFLSTQTAFPQFLLDKKSCSDPLYFVNASRGNAFIVEGCIRALLTLTGNPLGVPAGTRRADVPGVDALVRERIAPHVQYACLHWASHLLQCERNANTLLSLVGKFAMTMLPAWLETLAWMGRLDVAVPSLDAAANWWEIMGPKKRMLEDASEWMFKNHAQVEEQPDMVHKSRIWQESAHPRLRIISTVGPGIMVQ